MTIDRERLLEELSGCELIYINRAVGDDDICLSILKSVFKRVHIFQDPEDALNRLAQGDFSFVIHSLQEGDFPLIEKIKSEFLDTDLIVLAKSYDTDTLLKLIELHVDGFLIRPIQAEQLLRTLSRVLSFRLKLKEKQNLLNQYKEIVDESLIVSKTDLEGVITYVNDSFVQISEFKREELIGKPHNIVRHPDMKSAVFRKMWKDIKEGKIWRGVIKNRKKSGGSYYVDTVVKPIFDSDGEITEFIALRKDITDSINAEELIEDRLKNEKSFALLVLVKIENFKDLKIVYDERIINTLRIRLTKRVKNLLKRELKDIEEYEVKEDVIGFLVGEFRKDALFDFFTKVVSEVMNMPVKIGEFEYLPIVRLSYAYGSEHLYTNAMIGLEEIEFKEDRVIFSNGLCEEKKRVILKNMEILKDIEHALSSDGIISLFQPIVDNKTFKVARFESLVRIRSRKNELLSPFFFLDIAKKAGLYSNITVKVLKNSFDFYNRSGYPISINISPNDILRENVKSEIYSLLRESRIKKGDVAFELLEDELVRMPNILCEFVDEILSLNAVLSIDDFGSGYSNFTRVVNSRADTIKIDGFLIKDIAKDRTKRCIVESIVNFAKKEGKKTVAEFVENSETFNTVKELGVDFSQGYFFSPPIKAEDCEKTVSKIAAMRP